MPVWSFAHNWKRSVREALEFNTRVIVSDDGTEQRAELLDNPRRSLDYQCLLASADERRRADAMLFGAQGEVWDVPIWTDAVRIGESVEVGQTVLNGDFRWRDFDNDGGAMIWRNSGLWELVDLLFVSDSAVAISATANSWRPGDVIVPVRSGYLQEKLSGVFKKKDMRAVSPSFELLGTERSVRRFGVFTTEEYRDLPVLLRPANTADELSISVADRRVIFDPRTGLKFQTSPEQASRVERVFAWTAHGRESIGQLLDWISSRSGQRLPFWLFSWENDFAPVLPIGDADTFFDFKKFGFGDYYADASNRRDMAFRLKDGTFLPRRIAFDSASGDTERCTLSSALGIEVDSNLHTAGFLYPVRFATDRMELDWVSSRHVKFATTFVDIFPSLNLPAPTWFSGASYSVPLNLEFASNALSGLPTGVTYIGTRIYRDGVLLDTVTDNPTGADYTDSGVAFGNTYQYTLVNVFDVDGSTQTVSSPDYSWVFLYGGS
jgi:hypothetical protein